MGKTAIRVFYLLTETKSFKTCSVNISWTCTRHSLSHLAHFSQGAFAELKLLARASDVNSQKCVEVSADCDHLLRYPASYMYVVKPRGLSITHVDLRLLFSLKPKEMAKMRLLAVWID